MENGEILRHVPKAQQPRDQLAQQGGGSGPGNAHMKPNNKENIQAHIQQAGKNEKVQGRSGISQGADNAGQEIVEHGSGDAQENQKNVAVRVGKGVLGVFHPDKDIPAA